MPDPWHRIRNGLTRRSRGRDALVVRAGSARKRDAYKAATAGLTGLTAFSALAVTGAVAGTAAHEQAVKNGEESARPATPTARVVTRRRKHRTVVKTTVVHAVSGTSRPGTGGAITSAGSGSSASHASTGSGGSTPTHSAPRPAAPAPAPAPSSGS